MTASCTRNLTVIARNSTDGFYYTGFITSPRTGSEKNHHVIFHNITPQDVPVNHVINIGGAVPWPELKIWDYVLVRVRCKTNGIECYVPGRIKYLPIDFRHENRFYIVELYRGNLSYKIRRHIIKIGKEKYHEIVEYIYKVRRHHPIKFFSEPDLTSRRPLRRQRVKRKTFRDNTRSVSAKHARCYNYNHYCYSQFPTSRLSSASSMTHSITLSIPSMSSWSSKSSQRSKGSRASTDRLSEKKTRIAHFSPGEDVLARWQDDGWYYFGKVLTLEENGSVWILDSTGYEEKIRQEDIRSNNGKEVIQQYEKVIALHPRYVYSYAPATVLNVYEAGGYRVQFYDNTERRLPKTEIYKISHRKFKEDVEYIRQQEVKLSEEVLARDDVSGIYKPYMVDNLDYQTQQVFLKLPNNTYKKQSAIHVFPLHTLGREIKRNWEYVLGPLDPACTVYLPAQIERIETQSFRLMFCDGRNSHVKRSKCFYISEDYYKNATNYFLHQKPTN